MATPLDDGSYRLDMTIDAANYALFAFGALPADHPAVMAEMNAIRDRLWVQTGVGGVARYERDYYQQVERQDIVRVPGNPWAICTLWLAQHAIAAGKTLDDLKFAVDCLEWTQRSRVGFGRSGGAVQSVHRRADLSQPADVEPRGGDDDGDAIPAQTRADHRAQRRAGGDGAVAECRSAAKEPGSVNEWKEKKRQRDKETL